MLWCTTDYLGSCSKERYVLEHVPPLESDPFHSEFDARSNETLRNDGTCSGEEILSPESCCGAPLTTWAPVQRNDTFSSMSHHLNLIHSIQNSMPDRLRRCGTMGHALESRYSLLIHVVVHH